MRKNKYGLKYNCHDYYNRGADIYFDIYVSINIFRNC